MRTITPALWFRLGASTLILATGVGITILGVTLATGGGVHDVELEGIPQEEFRALGARLLEPDGEPTLSGDQAVAAALQNKLEGDVRETRLVRLVNDSARPKIDTLAWAVNFDPATVLRIPRLGGGPLNQNDESDPSTSSSACGTYLKYDVAFIDANTGEWLLSVQQSGSLEPEQDGSCPTVPGVSPPPSPTQVPGAETARP